MSFSIVYLLPSYKKVIITDEFDMKMEVRDGESDFLNFRISAIFCLVQSQPTHRKSRRERFTHKWLMWE